MKEDDEAEALRAVALRNASSILIARQRAEQELLNAKEALERKSEELAHSVARLKATLEATTDGVLVLDGQSQVTDYNENLLRMWSIPTPLGATRGEGLLDWMCSHLADPESARRCIGDIVAASVAESFDVLELADGRVFERTSRVQLVNGTIAGRVWSFRDITVSRRAEQQLRDDARAAQLISSEREQLLLSERAARASAEQMSQLKDEFLTNLSHELRTPLNAILGWASMLQRGNKDRTDFHKGLDTIERNARAQKQLIDDLLDMSRIISGKVRLDVQLVQPIVFIEAALDTARPAATAKGIRLEPILDAQAGPISGDPDRLQQVLWNLLSNAIKFTPHGGNVRVLLERVGSHVQISVTDTGVGVARDFLPHMFDRLRQADSSTTKRYSGLGLGLSIVKHMVELHGGSARAHSAGEGYGTSITIEVPLAAAHGLKDLAPQSGRPSAASQAKPILT